MIPKLHTPITLLLGVSAVEPKTTKTGKPYHSVTFTDGNNMVSVNFWDNGPPPPEPGALVNLVATWSKSDFGMEAKDISYSPATTEERAGFIAAKLSRPESQHAFECINKAIENTLANNALYHALKKLMETYGDDYRRAAAARTNHQAYSGGLCEHTAAMLQLAMASADAFNAMPYYDYQWDKEIIAAAIIFHDCGKIWENNYPADGLPLSQPFTRKAEYYGHIAIGTIIAHSIIPWHKYEGGIETRDHLCHIILSHHGQPEWGSPVEPKTPEAWLVHQIDNTEAKTWMMTNNIKNGIAIGDNLHKGTGPVRMTINPHQPSFQSLANNLKSTASDGNPTDNRPTNQEIWVYLIDDCEWYFAKSLEQAIAKYQEATLNFDCIDARPITEAEMDSLIYWDSMDKNEHNPEHWKCQCGKTPDGHSRWNGSAWQCHHGNPIGHVDMVNIHKLTFRQKLEKDIASGKECGFFATTEH